MLLSGSKTEGYGITRNIFTEESNTKRSIFRMGRRFCVLVYHLVNKIGIRLVGGLGVGVRDGVISEDYFCGFGSSFDGVGVKKVVEIFQNYFS